MTGFKDLIFKLRGGIWTLLFAAIYFSADPTRENFFVGLVFVIAGQLFRFWAAGCIGRYRGEVVGAQKLVTWGPYALARNPLYIANGLIGLGWGIMSGLAGMLIFAVTFTILYIMIIIPREEEFLRGKFGIEYAAYCRDVGRFFPYRLPLKLSGRYDGSILWRSERYSLLMTVLGTVLLAVKIR